MWSWFRRGKSVPQEPERVNVRRVYVDIDLGERAIWTYGPMDGRYFDTEWMIDASDRFDSWMSACGKTGFVPIGDGDYVPLCHVKKISARYEDLFVEV